MKIAMISEHASPLASQGGVDSGGQNVYAAWVALELARAGHAVEVFTRRDDPDLPTVVPLAPGVRVIRGDADTFPAERIDIEERLVAGADCVIAECPQERADLTTLHGARPEAIEVVPCGVEACEFGPGDGRARERLGIPAQDFVVLQLGRLVPRKGIDNVIRGIGELRRAHGIEATLLVVGGDRAEPDPVRTPEIARLQAVAREEGVADKVVFTGRRERAELSDYYCAADVFATTPWYEPFGITPLEAMACGRPVAGTAVGGIRRVRSNFTWQRVAAALASIYGSLGQPGVPELSERMIRL